MSQPDHRVDVKVLAGSDRTQAFAPSVTAEVESLDREPPGQDLLEAHQARLAMPAPAEPGARLSGAPSRAIEWILHRGRVNVQSH